MKQTAVEWLVEQIKGYEYDGNDFVYTGVISSDLIEQAKQMEKEQIVDAYWEGGQDVPTHNSTVEQYYAQTYNQNK
jgi:hypothetical protein